MCRCLLVKHACVLLYTCILALHMECMVSLSGVNVICALLVCVCVPGFPREHCVVLVVTAKKQLADDRAALLGNRCHERRGDSRSWMVLSVFSLHTCTRTHSQPTHTHPSHPTQKQTEMHTHAHADSHILTHFTRTHTHILDDAYKP